MAIVDLARNTLVLKVVLAGPPAVGKSSRLDQIGAQGKRMRFGSRLTGESELATLPLASEGSVRPVELEIYEWHGPEKADLRARALFTGLDGIIYIADAREDRHGDTRGQFHFLVENAGKTRVHRLPGLLLLGHMDEGLLRLSSFEKDLVGPTWSERLEAGIEEHERFMEAIKLFGEVMLARAL